MQDELSYDRFLKEGDRIHSVWRNVDSCSAKMLGARVPDVVMLLAVEATKLVVLGVLIAIPFAYYVVHAWLARFADRVEVSARSRQPD